MRISDWSSDVCSSDLSCRPTIPSTLATVSCDPIHTSWKPVALMSRHTPLTTALQKNANCSDESGCKWGGRSEEHTSELQSLMRISYAVFCLKKKNNKQTQVHA